MFCLRGGYGALAEWGTAALKIQYKDPGSLYHREGRRCRFGGTEQDRGRADGGKELSSDAEFCQAKGEAAEVQV